MSKVHRCGRSTAMSKPLILTEPERRTLREFYVVVSIGVGRARRTQFNWVVTGIAALVNFALNAALVPRYGMEGSAAATVAAFTVLFLGMAWHAQRIYRVPYQWRRVATALGAAVALT